MRSASTCPRILGTGLATAFLVTCSFDYAREGVFVWSNGEPWTYTAFNAPWEPTQPNGTGDCVQLGDEEDALFDVLCTEESDALCERTPSGS